ncbi:monovalent cation:H+ antiporter, CPA1 (nhx1) [Exophiala xenobiotica]|uniref:Sodium/hydrogen exchanger n=1 Tax=Vermiconidia calcicola TaxID=1690605 RepID=A0AAV9QL23_9PEZI|nr:monovalent cation:H+ antiporter, CPA1 (nhx1) [Exophiala xenobiotica]KAK5534847.1 monovalent cation:H+ antiporter, CPA1 (nhx1) [Chaetothyriales sp. CCFEE 6169]KAK5545583.1 monovalent cation:H+ antiporter, CPA1 (nhx1) [Vermiconidia calcicola]KAK5208500.1 monovalent cation:H+ antiporter, CPA1 (nhx1) [Exophiala xenobiotica]KAK5230035.1 monovalent cation:H+ antiporter, CPA1 (nhx1) [Exophiala xenobiotica]
MASSLVGATLNILRRQDEEIDPDGAESSVPPSSSSIANTSTTEPSEAGQKEIFSSWALFILIMLLIAALFTSYMLQQKKIQAVHETVISIFTGMVVGLVIRITPGTAIQDTVSFDYQFFFNLLLPPIILASGYELHQTNFFRNIGTILTFAFAGTFISAVSLGLILWLWTRVPFDGLTITWVEAISVGATLSATDPVTILAIFNLYKVEPKLYTIIFGESILNDAIAIVLFETAQRYREGSSGNLNVISLFEAIGIFLLVFFTSLMIGVIVGIGTALTLKYTLVRRFPKIESCLIILIAYASYFFSNGVHMSGIVSLLFCGITLKHYAYYNMSRRTQLTTKFIFQILAQLSENFIFIYLGLTLFTETDLVFKPLFILVSVVGICAARWLAVFPLSKAINYIIRLRAKRRGQDVAEEIPWHYQAMLFWAGLRGAVGVALAAGLQGNEGPALRATVLVVVVLTVIIFGGTTARMLEILGIRTGVVDEIDSDDEFDIETANGGTYYKRSGTAFGHNPRPSNIGLDYLESERPHNHSGRPNGSASRPRPDRGYSSSNGASPPLDKPKRGGNHRKNSTYSQREREIAAQQGKLLVEHDGGSISDDDEDAADLDLPPAAPRRKPSPLTMGNNGGGPYANDPRTRSAPDIVLNGSDEGGADGDMGVAASPATGGTSSGPIASSSIRNLLRGATADHTAWFRQLDEDFIKPHLLLDQHQGQGKGPPPV